LGLAVESHPGIELVSFTEAPWGPPTK